MGWQLDGTFERILPDYSATPEGVLWGQDLTASVKIIASRHDFHDQDIGDGIAACLNLDGLNSMRANLKMGGFKIDGLGAATALTEIPQYGQCAGDLVYAPGTGVLELFDRNGDLIDTVTLTPGTGGTGTVQQITCNPDHLLASQNPIVTISDLELAPMATPGQNYSGGISDIQIDDWGRVVDVQTGGFANTDLGVTRTPTTATVTSSTGTDGTINQATTGVAGVMTKQHVIDLENTVRLSGDQSVDGIKTFNSQIFAAAAFTSDGDVRMINLPTSIGGTTQIGDLYIDGGFIKIRES